MDGSCSDTKRARVEQILGGDTNKKQACLSGGVMGGVQSVKCSDVLPSLEVRLDAGACVPERKTDGAAGYDLCAFEGGEVQPGKVAKVRTGVYAAIPYGLFGSIKGRSGLATSGIFVFEGTIDSDYRGEICVLLYNTRAGEVFSYSKGQRIAQLVFVPFAVLNVHEVSELDLTARGDRGFGSTDCESVQKHPIGQQTNGYTEAKDDGAEDSHV
jgi:dUTP pyrophosphatase